MDKKEIISKLQSNHEAFINAIASMNEEQFNFSKEGKWNAGQTLDHLHRAVSTLGMALMLPTFVFSLLYGKANRPSRSYDEVVAKYQRKLKEGGKAHGRYLPTKISFSNQRKTEDALRKSVDGLCKRVDGYSEAQLDEFILPHPLMGRITLREMFYFTIYHAEHHRLTALRCLEQMG